MEGGVLRDPLLLSPASVPSVGGVTCAGRHLKPKEECGASPCCVSILLGEWGKDFYSKTNTERVWNKIQKAHAFLKQKQIFAIDHFMPLPGSQRIGPPCHLLVGSAAAERWPVGLLSMKGGGGGGRPPSAPGSVREGS